MTTPDADLNKALWLDITAFWHLKKTEQDVDKLRAALPKEVQNSLILWDRAGAVTADLIYAITVHLNKEKEAGRSWPSRATRDQARECIKAAKELLHNINLAQTVGAHGEQLATTFDNNLYTAPEIFKPGFEFLQKTQQDVDTLCAAMPEEIQKVKALMNRVKPVTPDLVYAIKVYLDMQKLAGKPCICATRIEAHECIKAAKELLEDYKDKDETFKATIAARDEDIATFIAKIAERKEDIATLEATIAARDEEIMTTKGKLAVCEGQVDTKDNQLKFAKLELAACKDQLKAKDDLLKSKDEQLKLSMALVASKDELAKAKQAPKGKPLACIN
jgi:hypothetical protein